MTSIRTALAAFILSIQKKAELSIAEVETGISLIEAVEADEFDAEMRALTGGGAHLREARLVALDAAKMAVKHAELLPAIEQFREEPWRTEVELQEIRRQILQSIDKRLAHFEHRRESAG